jgi:steroid Delta-isomerase
MSATVETTRQTLESYLRAWATNDRELLLSTFAEDAKIEDPVGTPPFVGHEGLGRFWDFAHAAEGRSLTPVLEEIRACGDQAVMRFVMQVRDAQNNLGLDLSIVEHASFAPDGRIAYLRAFWDASHASAPTGMGLLVPDIGDAYEG